MRRLDRAFDILAGRGRRSGAENVIERLERRLLGEPTVVRITGGADMNTTRPAASAARGWWRKPAVVVAVAAATALVVGGGILLGLRLGGGNGVAADSTVSTSPAQWSYPASAIPPFHATIAWDADAESAQRLGTAGHTANIEVWHESPGRFRFQQIELSDAFNLGGPGSFIVREGERMGWYSAADDAWREIEAWPYIGWMFWESELSGGSLAWAGECGARASMPRPEVIAGRATYHIACRGSRGDWDLWVDSQTGLILKMRGETPTEGDSYLGTRAAGGFEVFSIQFYDDQIPDGQTLFLIGDSHVAALLEEVPPFHLVLTVEGIQGYTEEIWYRDSRNWKIETLASETADQEPGAIAFLADGVYTFFSLRTRDGFTNAYWVDPNGGQHSDPLADLFPEDPQMFTGTPPACSEVGIETLLGRTARHLRCQWATGTEADRWLDIETGLQLKSAGGPYPTVRVLSIEFEPVFPADFTFAAEPGWCNLNDPSTCTRGAWEGTALTPSAEVPTFSGPLTDGTQFDLADLRGRPVIVFLWMDAFEAGLLEQWLTDFELLHQKWGNRVGFVSVPEMDDTDARRFVERTPLTHHVLACYAAGQIPNLVCAPETPSDLWDVEWPAWLMIDADGRAADLLRGGDTTYEAIDQMIAAAVDG